MKAITEKREKKREEKRKEKKRQPLLRARLQFLVIVCIRIMLWNSQDQLGYAEITNNWEVLMV